MWSVAWLPKAKVGMRKTGVKLTCVCLLGYALSVIMNEALITNASKRIFLSFRLTLTIRLRN